MRVLSAGGWRVEHDLVAFEFTELGVGAGVAGQFGALAGGEFGLYPGDAGGAGRVAVEADGDGERAGGGAAPRARKLLPSSHSAVPVTGLGERAGAGGGYADLADFGGLFDVDFELRGFFEVASALGAVFRHGVAFQMSWVVLVMCGWLSSAVARRRRR